MSLNFDVHNRRMVIQSNNDFSSREKFFEGRIKNVIIWKNKVIVLIYDQQPDSRLQDYKPLKNPDNVYCFDLVGNLIWQGGRFDGKLPEWLYEKPLEYKGQYPYTMRMDGNLIVLSYLVALGLYRWIDPETGKVIKEEWDKYGR